MCSRIYRIIIISGIILFVGGFLLVCVYNKGWNDAVVKMRIEENDRVAEMVKEKENIYVEIVKKTVPEKRKALSRYVVKGD